MLPRDFINDPVPNSNGSHGKRLNVDFLMLAACDNLIKKHIQPGWRKKSRDPYWGMGKSEYSEHLLEVRLSILKMDRPFLLRTFEHPLTCVLSLFLSFSLSRGKIFCAGWLTLSQGRAPMLAVHDLLRRVHSRRRESLSFPRGLCGGSIDINLAFMSKEVANQPENTFNCLHTYPNIAWEDPGPEGDGDFLKMQDHSRAGELAPFSRQTRKVLNGGVL